MKNIKKYRKQYFLPKTISYDWVCKDYIDKPPIWCSVDLRDGNQALVVPMTVDEKIEFFNFLVELGFKEIEIGFPAASETEFNFCRRLIERNLIPEDVTIQVLTQSRNHIIKRTFEALSGCENAIVHLYNSTSLSQREQVFKKSKQEIIDIAVNGAKYMVEMAKNTLGNFRFMYSPESFTGTEMDFAVEVSNSVIDIFEPTVSNKLILNFPATVEHSLPHIYASQIEFMAKNIKKRNSVIISLHPHNDRGCAIADAELGLLAGADRIEGTLFGNGERTGNVDLVTLGLNLYCHGVDPLIDFSNIPNIVSIYEKLTKMSVHSRHPYAGSLVFAAFSGSHQDAIAKGIKYRTDNNLNIWNVPYLPIDPLDIGRVYEKDVIRINSQSGKGGIGYILEANYGLKLPTEFKETFGYFIKNVSDNKNEELSPSEIYKIFFDNFVNLQSPIKIIDLNYDTSKNFIASVRILNGNKELSLEGCGKGRLEALFNALSSQFNCELEIDNYYQHAIEKGALSKACCYIKLKSGSSYFFGVGIDNDIINASVYALVCAINKAIFNN